MTMLALTFESAGAWTVIISSIGTTIVLIINAIFQHRTGNKVKKVSEQVNNAAEAATAAALKVEEVKIVTQQAVKDRNARLDEIHEDIRINTEVSKEAFKEANGMNRKLESLHEATLATAQRIDRHSEALDLDKPRTPTRPLL